MASDRDARTHLALGPESRRWVQELALGHPGHAQAVARREVFVAVALNEVPMDVLALELGSNRNAIYKNLFDARRRLRARLAEAGHSVADDRLRTTR